MRRIFVAVLALSLYVPQFAHSATNALFTNLDGEFKGKGSAIVSSDGKKTRILCNVKNVYNASTGKLAMTGKCASAKGSRKVNGAIFHKGNTLTGTYMAMRSGIKMTKSSGQASGNTLTISSTFFDEQLGKLIRIRQVIKVSDGGFVADVFAYDNKSKKYKAAGNFNFKRKGQ